MFDKLASLCSIGLLAIVLIATVSDAAEPNDAFDRHIAPLLARRCMGCHNASDQEGGLNLAVAADALAGGENGRAIQPGNPSDSLLWKRVVADEMPPEHPLAGDEKTLLKQWISAGAKWGTDPIDPFRFSTNARGGYDWWSLQPIAKPNVPQLKDSQWPRNAVDAFVLAKLRSQGLSPAAQAPPKTLLRRLYFDLIGLPPILQSEGGKLHEKLLGIEIDLNAFGKDPQAYAAVVDRLLESPHYGERWARHWLDVIRFGESQGFERNRIRENAWRYRDWVINALNRDMPYDEFVRQQIAGDVLYPNDLDALIATGFLVCGTWDMVGNQMGSPEMKMSVRQDELEDMVAAFGQSVLGLTANCARCHDHKFDPISQREYYQLAAALGGVTQQEFERKGISARPSSDAHQRWVKNRDKRRQELAALEKQLRAKHGRADGGEPIEGLQVLYLPDDATDGKRLADRSDVGEPLHLTVGGKPRFASSQPAAKLISAIKSSREMSIEVWLTPTKESQSGPARIVTLSKDANQRNFTLGQDGNRFDLRLRNTKTDRNGLPSLASPAGSVKKRKTHVVFTLDQSGEVRSYVGGKQVASRRGSSDLSNWTDDMRLAIGDELSGDRRWEGDLHFVAIYSKTLAPKQIARNFASESRDVRSGEPMSVVLGRASNDERTRFKSLQAQVELLERAEPTLPFDGVAHMVIPKQPPEFHVLARGDFRSPLAVVAPRGIEALSRGGLPADFGLKPNAPEAERRKALAMWAGDSRNPLTPRVQVNRMWHYHFGQGIVNTPSDLGFAGGRPTHPQLLDWLAQTFVDGGWRMKPIHRLIVTSATWRQASNVANQRAQNTDAGNRYLWRANYRRLDGESTRDAMLAVSGALNPKLGGPSFRDVAVEMENDHKFGDPTGEFNDEVNRRTVYRLWARSGNNPLLESLDCPDPSVMLPRRPQTITPVQSLALLNSRYVEQCAGQLAKQAKQEVGDDLGKQITRLYQQTLGRSPDAFETKSAVQFAKKRGLDQFCLVLLNTNEFLFLE